MVGLVIGIVRMALDFGYGSPDCGEEDKRPVIIGRLHFLHFTILLFVVSFVATVVITVLTPPIKKSHVSVCSLALSNRTGHLYLVEFVFLCFIYVCVWVTMKTMKNVNLCINQKVGNSYREGVRHFVSCSVCISCLYISLLVCPEVLLHVCLDLVDGISRDNILRECCVLQLIRLTWWTRHSEEEREEFPEEKARHEKVKAKIAAKVDEEEFKGITKIFSSLYILSDFTV